MTIHLTPLTLLVLGFGVAMTWAVFRRSQAPDLPGGQRKPGDLGVSVQAGAAVVASLAIVIGFSSPAGGDGKPGVQPNTSVVQMRTEVPPDRS